jgi:hypothetical protein
MAFKEYNRNSPNYGEFLAPSADMVAGRLVMIDAGAPTKVAYADNTITSTKQVLGLLGQNVIAANINTHQLPSIYTRQVRYGDPVSVFYNEIYDTDQTSDNITAGELLYPAAPGVDDVDKGKLSNTPIVDQDPVALALTSGNEGVSIKVKLLV